MEPIISIYATPVLRLIDAPIIIFYTFIFFVFSNAYVNFRDQKINTYFRKGIFIRFFILIAHFSLNTFYYGYGDTFGYHKDAHLMWINTNSFSDFYNYIFESQQDLPSHLDVFEYYQVSGTFLISKIDYIISYLTFNSYLTNCLFFSLFAYWGLWKLYVFFTSYIDDPHYYLVFGICFFPSTIFWSSLVMKDSVCVGALGFFCFYANRLIQGSKTMVADLVFLCLSSWLLFAIKPYILSTITLSFLLVFMINNTINQKRGKPKLFTLIISFLTIIFALYSFVLIGNSDSLVSLVGIAQDSQKYQNDFQESGIAGSVYNINFSPDVLGMFFAIPSAIGVTLFRPFLWEVNSVLMLFQCLESSFIIYLLIKVARSVGIYTLLKKTLSTDILLFCLIFALIFAFIVGIMTFNFGTLARYKTPLIPFLLTLIFHFLGQIKKSKYGK